MQKKIIGAILSFIILFSSSVTGIASYNPELQTQENIIENTLTNYQIFAKNNINIQSHVMGGIAAGGSAEVESWGDISVAPSYLNHLIKAGNFAAGNLMNEEYAEFKNTNCYYSTTESNVNVSNFSQKPDYINFEDIFDKIQSECNEISENSYKISINDCKMSENFWSFSEITLDLSKHKNYNIPYSIYEQIDLINFIGVDGIDQLSNGNYSVSITGVNDKDINITFGYSNPASEKKRICINGKELSNDNSFKNITGCEQGGQVNLNGMTLIWNFPDAQGNISLERLAGHIAAPNAHIELLGGNYEGGIIADSIYSNSEGHFFSYLSLKSLPQDDSNNEASDVSTKDDSSSELDVNVSKCKFHYTDDFGNDLMTNEFSKVTKLRSTVYFTPKAPRFLNVQGYNLIGWQELNDDGSVKREISGNDIDDICNKLEETRYPAGKLITFKAIYEIPDDPYTLTVTNGSVYVMENKNDTDYNYKLDKKDTYKFANYEQIKLSAPETNSYGSFQYWSLNGMVYSYDNTIFFSTWCDADFEAVYSEEKATITPAAFISNDVQEFGFETSDTNYHKITFNCAFYIPNKVEFISAGLIFTPTQSSIEDLTNVTVSETSLTNLPVKTAVSTARKDQLYENANNQVLMSLTGMKNGVSRYARSFLIYKENGIYKVVFSEGLAGITTSQIQ